MNNLITKNDTSNNFSRKITSRINEQRDTIQSQLKNDKIEKRP